MIEAWALGPPDARWVVLRSRKGEHSFTLEEAQEAIEALTLAFRRALDPTELPEPEPRPEPNEVLQSAIDEGLAELGLL